MERERRSEIQISGIKGKGEAESPTVSINIHPISNSNIKILWAYSTWTNRVQEGCLLHMKWIKTTP